MTNKFFLPPPAPVSCSCLLLLPPASRFPPPIFSGRPIPPKMHLQKWELRIYRIVDNPKLYSLLKAQDFNRPAETNHRSPVGPTHFRPVDWCRTLDISAAYIQKVARFMLF